MVVSATAATAVAAAFAVVLTGAWAGRDAKPASAPLVTSPHGHSVARQGPPEAPLRAGERFVTLRMPTAYTPKAPAAPGTDDYRCFLLDPGLTAKSVVTGLNILPGNPDVVHHVILFRVPADKVARAEEMDRLQAGQGWTCFGGTGVESQGAGLTAPRGWVRGPPAVASGCWPPTSVCRSRRVRGSSCRSTTTCSPDGPPTRARPSCGWPRTTAPARRSRRCCCPAPVEVPCRPGHPGPLCDRKAAMADVQQRFGVEAGRTGDLLHLLCPGNKAGPTQTCTRPVTQTETIRAVAGHMHLLGTKISITVNKGKADERTILDIPVWDFDDQGSRPVEPGGQGRPGRHPHRVVHPRPAAARRAALLRRACPSATSSGARARPTRCAWASSWSPVRSVTAVPLGWPA